MGKYILHLPKWYPNAEDDLEGIFVKRHIEASHTKFAIVIFAKVCKQINSNKIYYIQESKLKNGIEYLAYYRKEISGILILDRLIKFLLYFFLLSKLIKATIKKYGLPELIHVHVLLRSSIIAFVFSSIYRVPFLITEHSTYYTSGFNKSKYNFKNRIRKFIVRNARAVITVSKDLEIGMHAFGLYNKNYFLLYNSVDIHIFTNKIHLIRKGFSFLHVSEFKNDHKNLLGLLEVVRLLSLKYKNFKLNLIGYGKDLDLVLGFIQMHQLTEIVKYHGKLQNLELANWYQSSDALVLFSNKENMPCVIAEALCCGTPVISTGVGGIAEVININNGILIEKGNSIALYASLESLLNGTKNFDPETISRDAQILFSTGAIGNRLDHIYSICLNTLKVG
ncbi:MAG: glycosyltransferase [Saprospiraceae bacterium]